ncbi:MAG: DNA alkylation repair protein [Myxococcota bacterium]
MPMTLPEVMTELEALGSEQTRKTWRNHGAPEPMFGVKIGDLKTILKKTKTDPALAEQLWATGNTDAQYLAALMCDPKRFTPGDLDRWMEGATWYMLAEYSVAWVAGESGHGWTCGTRWIEDPRETVAVGGWATLACHVIATDDAKLDVAAIDALLERVRREIHGERNYVRYTMNGFVIAVGGYVAPCAAHAKEVANAIGEVKVDMGGTSCKVPYAPDYIEKTLARGPVQKRKKLRC